MNFGIFTHKKPDADAFGSSIALALLLDVKAWFLKEDWEARPESIRAIHKKWFEFVDPHIGFFDESQCPATHENIVADCGDPGRISAPEEVLKAGFRWSYDHHCNAPVADSELGSPDLPAAAVAVAKTWNMESALDRAEYQVPATLLFAGLMGDTGGFSNSAATAEAFEYAKLLMNAGADADLVRGAFYSESEIRARLKAVAVQSLVCDTRHDGLKVNTAIIKWSEFSKLGATRREYAGMPGELLRIGGADISACLLQDDNNPELFRIAFRTKGSCPVKAKALAQAFNGDGHPDAAGGSVRARTPEFARYKVRKYLKLGK